MLRIIETVLLYTVVFNFSIYYMIFKIILLYNLLYQNIIYESKYTVICLDSAHFKQRAIPDFVGDISMVRFLIRIPTCDRDKRTVTPRASCR